MKKKRIEIWLDEGVIRIIEEKAKKVDRSRKKYIELLIIDHSKL